MKKYIVGTMPDNVERVKPSEPYYTADVQEFVTENGVEVERTVPLIHKWEMGSTLARLVGEAKSMRGRFIKVGKSWELGNVACWFAWYAGNTGVMVFRNEENFYLVKGV
jgi:hypothetical protein